MYHLTEAKRQELQAALAPFANLLPEALQLYRVNVDCQVSLSDVRRASEALSTLGSLPKAEEPLSVARIAEIESVPPHRIGLVWHVSVADLEARGVVVDALLYTASPQPAQAPQKDGWAAGTEVQCGLCQQIKSMGDGCERAGCPCTKEMCGHG